MRYRSPSLANSSVCGVDFVEVNYIISPVPHRVELYIPGPPWTESSTRKFDIHVEQIQNPGKTFLASLLSNIVWFPALHELAVDFKGWFNSI